MNTILEKIKRIDLFSDRERMKKVAIWVLLVLIIGVAFVAKSGSAAERSLDSDIPEISDETEIDESGEATGGMIYVDIGGAVNEPMLAELPQGSRVEDAIVAAGGLTDKADITNINRAEFLEDGMKIYIPEQLSDSADVPANSSSGSSSDTSEGVTTSSGSTSSAGSVSASSKVNINTADSSQLQEINGVGPATAQKIIDYRTSNGRFQSIEDIKNVSGIGDKTYEKLKDQITT